MLPSILSLMLKSSHEATMMTPLDHDPETTAMQPMQEASEPLGRLADAAEALQTWASDLAAQRARRPSLSPSTARAIQLRGEALLAEVLQAAAPVIGELGSIGGGR